MGPNQPKTYADLHGVGAVTGSIARAATTQAKADALRDAERYRQIRLGLSNRHGDVYAMVFAGDGDYPTSGDDLDRIVDAALASQNAGGVE